MKLDPLGWLARYHTKLFVALVLVPACVCMLIEDLQANRKLKQYQKRRQR